MKLNLKIIAANHLNSRDALLKMSELQPDKSIAHALANILLGLFSQHLDNGKVYYHNEGFINKPSKYDIKYGTEVFPVDHREELLQLKNKTAFFNGVIAQETSLTSEEKTRLDLFRTQAIGAPQHEIYNEYTAVLKGVLNGQEVKFYTITDNEDFAKKLTTIEKGNVIFAFGNIDQAGDVKVQQVGKSFASTQPR